MCIFDSSNAKPETPLMDNLYWSWFRMRVIGRCLWVKTPKRLHILSHCTWHDTNIVRQALDRFLLNKKTLNSVQTFKIILSYVLCHCLPKCCCGSPVKFTPVFLPGFVIWNRQKDTIIYLQHGYSQYTLASEAFFYQLVNGNTIRTVV